MTIPIRWRVLLLLPLLLGECCPEETLQPEPPPPVTFVDILHLQGHYRGQLPCADCNHIELDLTLYPDLCYRMSTLKVGHVQKPPQLAAGRFLWREDRLIQLDGAGDHMVFFVDTDGSLQMRGNDGKAYPNHRGEICHLNKMGNLPE